MNATLSRLHLFSLLAAGLACSAWSIAAVADEETSVLVEPQPEAAASVPKLVPPANGSTLPPPEMPQKQSERAEPEALPQPTKPATRQPFMRPSVPQRHEAARSDLTSYEPGRPVEVIPAPAVEERAYEVAVRPTPRIKYDTDRDARRMYRRSGEMNVVMVTENPADGCFYEIPLCIPACCTGEPTISGGRGIFGRGVVEYCWPNGFRAIVKFRQVLGDVRVDYEGD